MGSTHALTARRTAAGSGPCFVLVRLLRWYATTSAFDTHFSTCFLKDSVWSSQMPSHRIAASAFFSMSPCRTVGTFLRGFLEKCMTSVLAGSKEMPLAAPQE